LPVIVGGEDGFADKSEVAGVGITKALSFSYLFSKLKILPLGLLSPPKRPAGKDTFSFDTSGLV